MVPLNDKLYASRTGLQFHFRAPVIHVALEQDVAPAEISVHTGAVPLCELVLVGSEDLLGRERTLSAHLFVLTSSSSVNL